MQHVYIMRDPRNHNDIKVGFSINPIERRKQLYRTNTPLPFNLSAVWAVSDQRIAESIAHFRLSDHRINDRREWFEIVPAQIIGTKDFPLYCNADYDFTSDCLDVLVELIQEDFCSYSGLQWQRIFEYKDLLLSVSLEDIIFLQ
ncbi:GIY-YIG nuclease family protein [Pseudoalteromonas sp. SWYJ118]|jgi:hypothetical protein|uniref:GIY-YIG nuclease family protein n=1 Tax=Pseudoalteromonas sp. SWYJ118 TaxID=2792062 RepID=UPI0018CD7B0F|nr:GIY-YIG nuclease family protein [Pseudoalteromonas sp. SWYJ118]MBH0074014.1 GIY-YIG nuclease family protein [Pseudoalteromonas sp. SWYJ118]